MIAWVQRLVRWLVGGRRGSNSNAGETSKTGGGGSPAAADPVLVQKIKEMRQTNAKQAQWDVYNDIYAAQLNKPRGWQQWGLYATAVVLACFVGWASLSELEEVTSGSGKVIPTSREQVIQILESGVLAELLVAEGDTVQEGQALLRIDDVKQSVNITEGRSKMDALLATAARLRAESRSQSPSFPAELRLRAPLVVSSEQSTYESRLRALQASVASQEQSIRLSQDELRITEPMAAKGLVSDVDVLRIRRALADAKGRIGEMQSKYRADASTELVRVEAELNAQSAQFVGREDSLKRTILRAPKRGVIKNIRVTTLGAVINSGQDILEIIPLGDNLLVETRIRPSDIAFLRPGMDAVVKITAYDSGTYGWLTGKLVLISPDTIKDDVKRDEVFYKVLVRTDVSHLSPANGKILPIIPGMLAQVDIRTGRKSVLDYLFKPLLKAQEALRER
jgi:membrane fusion protein, adhesin transport system